MHRNDPAVRSVKKGVYRHSKTGNEYEVIGVALHSETAEQLILYRPLYESEYEFFVRPYDMFFENVEIDGRSALRFIFIRERV